MNIQYTVTGNAEMDDLLGMMAGDSYNDPRFKINVGDYVCVMKGAGGSPEPGTIAQVRGRRNGYPEPLFTGYWFPLLYLEHVDGSPGGGEIHEDCVRIATQKEQELT